jgi:hypothetical protein
VLLAGSKANRELAGAVHRRVGAEASMVAAKAWLLRCTAVGVLAMMVGAGVGLAFLGYARSKDASGAAERLADTLTKALERAKLHAELNPDASVKLDPAAQVAMDPAAQVHLADDKALPHPTREQLKEDASPASKAQVKTNYTIFKAVHFGTGEVVTGYNFAPQGTVPEHQYCYFADGIDRQSFKTLHIAAEGRYIAPVSAPPGFDARQAAQNCVWFDGRPTLF